MRFLEIPEKVANADDRHRHQPSQRRAAAAGRYHSDRVDRPAEPRHDHEQTERAANGDARNASLANASRFGVPGMITRDADPRRVEPCVSHREGIAGAHYMVSRDGMPDPHGQDMGTDRRGEQSIGKGRARSQGKRNSRSAGDDSRQDKDRSDAEMRPTHSKWDQRIVEK